MFQSDFILYVEDDHNYADLLKCLLKQANSKFRLYHVSKAEDAMAYLKGEEPYTDRSIYPLPGLVLVDLKMPRINGFELLDWIRRHSDHPHVPVVVLTSSDEIRDAQRAYELGANSFLVKPPNVNDLQEMLAMLNGYWLKYNVALQGKVPKTAQAIKFPGEPPKFI